MPSTSGRRWTLLVLLIVLVAIRLALHPLALRHEKIDPVFAHLVASALALITACAVAFLVGSRAPLRWLTKQPAHYWFALAIGLLFLPTAAHLMGGQIGTVGNDFVNSVNWSRYSLLVYFAGLASLASPPSVRAASSPQGLGRFAAWNFLGASVIWTISILYAGGGIFTVVLGLVTAMVMTQRTQWFASATGLTLAVVLVLISVFLCKSYLFARLLNSIFPWDSPLSRGFVGAQIQKTIAAGWSSTEVPYFFIPAASSKFMLAVSAHYGWLSQALLSTTLLAFLWLLYKSLTVFGKNRWLKRFGLAVHFLVTINTIVNSVANTGLIAPAGFALISSDPYLITCTSFLTGLVWRSSKESKHA